MISRLQFQIEEAWSVFLKVLLYSIFHPLLRQPDTTRRKRILVRQLSRMITSYVADKQLLVFCIVFLALFMAWLTLIVNHGRTL